MVATGAIRWKLALFSTGEEVPTDTITDNQVMLACDRFKQVWKTELLH